MPTVHSWNMTAGSSPTFWKSMQTCHEIHHLCPWQACYYIGHQPTSLGNRKKSSSSKKMKRKLAQTKEKVVVRGGRKCHRFWEALGDISWIEMTCWKSCDKKEKWKEALTELKGSISGTSRNLLLVPVRLMREMQGYASLPLLSRQILHLLYALRLANLNSSTL